MQVASLFLCCLFLVSVVPSFAADDGSGEGTPRQKELFHKLLTLRPSDYSGPEPWMLQSWDTDSGLEELVRLPSGSGNAAVHFKLLEELFELEREQLEQGGEDSRGVAALLEAAETPECRLTPDYYPEYDSAVSKQPDYGIMRTYLRALLRRGERAFRGGDNREAERCYVAALICGRHLTRDKTSLLVYMCGIVFKMQGAHALEQFWRRTNQVAKAENVKRYFAGVSEVFRLLEWKLKTGLGESGEFASLPCIVRIATGDKEAFWRKEAVTRLAVLRHGVQDKEAGVMFRNPEYERIAEQALSSVVSNDPDPSVRRLALWAALNLNPDKEGTLPHRFE